MNKSLEGHASIYDHRWKDSLLSWLGRSALWVPLGILVVLLGKVLWEGASRLSVEFLTSYPSRFPEAAGIVSPIVGSFMLIMGTVVVAVPLGIGAAVYLEEYAEDNGFTRLLEVNISTLAGVPSVVYGLLGLELFVRIVGLGRSVAAGSLTLSLLVLPIVIIASREAIRTVPDDLREAALGLGADRWTVVRRIILPTALPGIMTGTILSISRAIGETAPIILVGALAYIAFIPYGPGSPYTALPMQIFNWISRPQPEFERAAAAAIIVLLGIVLTLNALAIYLRDRMQQRMNQ